MGFLNTVKGWLNIGGVKVKLQGVSQRVSRSGDRIDGSVLLKSKGDKTVLKLTVQFVMKITTKKKDLQGNDQRESKDYTIAESIMDLPFDMKEGETKVMPFSLTYSLEQRMQDRGGFVGAMGALGAMLSNQEEEYLVRAMCDVKGTVLDPGDSIAVVLVD